MDMRFQGRVCPLCNQPFREGDVIAVCDTCGVPQHFSCRQRSGRCATPGCSGRIREVVGNPNAPQPQYAQQPYPPRQQQPYPPRQQQPYPPRQQQPYQPQMQPNPGMQRYDTLFQNEPNIVPSNVPVALEKVTLVFDRQFNTLNAVCWFRNLAAKPISALLVDVACRDSWGKELEPISGFQFLNLRAGRGAVFGNNNPIPMPDPSTRDIEVTIKKVLYADRTLVDASESCIKLPKQAPLESHFGSVELAREYVRETAPAARFAPAEAEGYWKCACGAINSADEEVCYSCRSNKQNLFALLDTEILGANLAAYNEQLRIRAERERAAREEQRRMMEERARREQEERERQERLRLEDERQRKLKRKKTTRRTVLIIAAALLAGFLTYATIWHIIPYTKYNKACAALEAKSYDDAYDRFVALDDFADSQDKAVDTLYQKALDQMNGGSYRDAADTFNRVHDYKDSAEKSTFCVNKADYLDAKALFDSGKYSQASAAFKKLGGFEDSADMVTESDYQNALVLLDSEDYDGALEAFKALDGYKDSSDMIKETYYRHASKCFDNGDYSQASTLFKKISSYKDARSRGQEATYLYGKDLYNKKDYAGALAAYNTITGYKDVNDLIPKTKYKAADAAYEKKDYKTAYELFKELSIKNYKDSADRKKDAGYMYGKKLMSNKDYVEAVRIFDLLGSYKDSKTKIKEAKYAYVLAHKNRTDSTTYQYLKDLKKAEYKDSKSIYSSLYKWKVSLFFNDSSYNETSSWTSISKYKTIYCHVKLQGGPPGGSVKLKYKVKWPNGSTSTKSWSYKWYDGETGYCYFWYNNPYYGKTGTMKVSIYTEGGTLLGSATIRITG